MVITNILISSPFLRRHWLINGRKNSTKRSKTLSLTSQWVKTDRYLLNLILHTRAYNHNCQWNQLSLTQKTMIQLVLYTMENRWRIFAPLLRLASIRREIVKTCHLILTWVEVVFQIKVTNLNSEQCSNIVHSVNYYYVDRELVQGTDSTIWDENQVSSVPESSHNNPLQNGSLSLSDKFIIEFDSNDFNLSDLLKEVELDEANTAIDTPPNKLRVKLRDIAMAVYWIKSVIHEVSRKKARSASQNGESIVSSD